MAKELTSRENTDVGLSKSKSFMGIIKNIFNNKIILDNDSWMQRLWDWADENDVPDYSWIEDDEYDEGGYWQGFPRDREILLNLEGLILDEIKLIKLPKEIGNLHKLTILSLRKCQLVEVVKEIGSLNSLKTLSLWGNQLKSLPKEIGNLSNLNALILGENQLTLLPKEIGNLNKLSRLLIWSNQLVKLPKEVGNLRSLTILDLEGNQITHLPREISNLTNLSELTLTRNLLKTLPSEMKYLDSLKILIVEDNLLKDIPREISEMKSLKELYLKNNLLTNLPNEIIDLDTLTDISLKGNSIVLTELQKKWFHDMLTSHRGFIDMDDEPLREVYTYEETEIRNIMYNDIEFDEGDMSVAINRSMMSNSDWIFLHTNFNGAIKWMEDDGWDKIDTGIYVYPTRTDDSKYKKIHVTYDNNGFPILKAELIDNYQNEKSSLNSYLNHVPSRDITDNNVVSSEDNIWIQRLFDWADENNIPDYKWIESDSFEEEGYWEGLPRDRKILLEMKVLNIGRNEFVKLPKEIWNLTQLVELILDENKLTELSKEIGNLKNLTKLNLAWNELTELPQELWELTNLTELKLLDNKLRILPKEIGNLIKLTELQLAANPFVELPKEIWSLVNLSKLSFSDLYIDISQEIWNLKKLTELHLENIQLMNLSDEVGNLINLTELSLYWNQLMALPDKLWSLINLTELNLYGNKLIKLSPKIQNLNNLTKLNIGSNRLIELPKEIGNLTSLIELYLANNQLERLPKEIGLLTSLTELNLEENLFTKLPNEITNLTNLSTLYINGNPNLVFTLDQIRWIKELKINGCDIHLDDNVLDESKSIENIKKLESKDTFTFDNGRILDKTPGKNSSIIESLYAIIHNFSDKKLCIKKQFNKVRNEETDIYYSIIGQKHLDYSGSKFNVEDVKNIYEETGSFGVCESGIKVKINSYIEWRFDFYQNDIYLEAILVKNKIRTKLYNRTLRNGPSELLSVYAIYIENGYKEGIKIFEGTENYYNNQNSNNNLQSKISQDNEPLSIEDIISQKGLAYAVEGAVLLVNNKIHSEKIALQFILEELDAAKNGNLDALDFVKNSGFEASEYIGAMSNSFSQVDGSEGPQMTLHSIAMHISDINLKVKFIIQIVNRIMKIYSLGKYSIDKRNQFYKKEN